MGFKYINICINNITIVRIIATIKNKLEQNARERVFLSKNNSHKLPTQQIQLDFLSIEAQTYNEMLSQVRSRKWSLLRNRKTSALLAIVTMSLYVLGIFYMFKEMDLSKVEHWQFGVTILPFWLILTLIPVAIIELMTTRNKRF